MLIHETLLISIFSFFFLNPNNTVELVFKGHHRGKGKMTTKDRLIQIDSSGLAYKMKKKTGKYWSTNTVE